MTRPEPERRDPLARFEEELRRHAARPPATPPGIAARRVMARLAAAERRPAGVFHLRWAVVAAAVVLAAGAWFFSPSGPRFSEPPVAAGPPALGEGVVLLWLDPETPLYMSLTPPSRGAENGGES